MGLDYGLLIEIVGAAIALVYIYFEYKASIWLWRIGILMSLFYIVIFSQSKFYADAGIYLYNLGANIYGLWVWHKHSTPQSSEASPYDGISRMPAKYWRVLIPIIVVCWAGLALLLKYCTDSPVPIGDSFTTALSVVAMWVLARKYYDAWLFWIVVNAVSAGLYLWQGLYPTFAVFIVYTIISCAGLRKWKKESRTDNLKL